MMSPCEFCGQVVEHDSDREPWEVCQCREATERRKQGEAIEQAFDGVERIFGEECTEIGFVPVDETTMAVIKRLVEDVGRDRVRSISVRLINGESVNIKMDGTEVRIVRKQQKKAEV